MANTRFNYDEARTVKRLQEATDIGRYMINTPGQGTDPTYISDIHIIPQKWGGNLCANPTTVETDLFGIHGHMLSKGDCIPKRRTSSIEPIPLISKRYPINNTEITSESRYTDPVWITRDQPATYRWDYPFTNPQQHFQAPFLNNIDTRVLSKDYYLYKV